MVETTPKYRLNDYSLVGKDSRLAVEKGLAEAKWYASPVAKEEMRNLLERRDGPAIRDTLIWFGLLFLFGASGYLLWGSGWAVIPFLLYSLIYASSSDSRWHEAGHGTAFKTDWMNNALYEIASFMVLRESVPWRWSHTRHHSDTIIVGRDPEIVVQRPTKLLNLIANYFNLMALRMYVKNVLLHCTGRLNEQERTYIPESETGKVVLRARLYVMIYAAVFALAIYTGSVLPLLYIGLPSFYGAWLMVIYGYTQHAGLAENVLDHRLNTRSVYMNFINRYLYWNMNYHIEHHMFPMVPYHALPRLHALIKDDLPKPSSSILAAYREIIPAVLRMRTDPAAHIRRTLPPPAQPVESKVVTPASRPDAQGWVEIGPGSLVMQADVIRVDHAGRTYALYRTADDRYYATDGTCTHGNAHLAEGYVTGTLIECPKHNGRFDIRDGSPQRQPVCVGLKTYPVENRGGSLFINFSTAGGFGVTQVPPTYTFRVVSNDNVATYIKELVLELLPGQPKLDYQPGDYLQFDIPAYPETSLQTVAVGAPYAEAWQAQRLFDLTAHNPAPCRRNYSIASNPASEALLRFNVRLATPPLGQGWNTGVGSAYLFGLQPGDQVSAIGPFGDFHIRDTGREMVYLGGGSGMAPLRSHIAYLLETLHTTRKVSYWYGARAQGDLFYQSYFEDLARRYPNFSFHAALSEPQPHDQWSGHAGFIHAVLQRQYLAAHPDPQAIDYYLCGPPAMIRAAISMLAEYGVGPAQIAYDEF